MATVRKGGKYQRPAEMYLKLKPSDDKEQPKQMSIDMAGNKNKQ